MYTELEQSLFDFVGRELHEAAWRGNFSIHPGVALSSFFEAFRQQGAGVVYLNKEQSASFRLPWHKKLFETTLSYEEIKNGWKNKPPCSPKAVYDSICMVYDLIGENLKAPLERNKWFYFREKESREVRNKMEKLLVPYFLKHHEHMFLPLSMKVPELVKPVIFDKVLMHYSIALHEKVCIWELKRKGCLCGPCPEYIAEFAETDFNEDYHPSDNAMTQYFWGLYLNEFARSKKYRMFDSSDKSDVDRIRSLTIRGVDGLMSWQPLLTAKVKNK